MKSEKKINSFFLISEDFFNPYFERLFFTDSDAPNFDSLELLLKRLVNTS